MVRAMEMCRADQSSADSMKGFTLIPVTTGQKSIFVPEVYNSNCFFIMTSTNHLDTYRPVLRGVYEVQTEFSFPQSLTYQDISTLKLFLSACILLNVSVFFGLVVFHFHTCGRFKSPPGSSFLSFYFFFSTKPCKMETRKGQAKVRV